MPIVHVTRGGSDGIKNPGDALYAGVSVESSGSAVEWGAIAAGALGAVGVSFGPGISCCRLKW
jgi:hypothetical protein